MDASAGSADPRSFPAVLARLIEWIEEIYYLPSWSTVAVVEMPGNQVRGPVPAVEFSERYEQILAMGHRDWVNVGFVGVEGEVLVVRVEYHTMPLDSGAHYLRHEITAVFSGASTDSGIPMRPSSSKPVTRRRWFPLRLHLSKGRRAR